MSINSELNSVPSTQPGLAASEFDINEEKCTICFELFSDMIEKNKSNTVKCFGHNCSHLTCSDCEPQIQEEARKGKEDFLKCFTCRADLTEQGKRERYILSRDGIQTNGKAPLFQPNPVHRQTLCTALRNGLIEPNRQDLFQLDNTRVPNQALAAELANNPELRAELDAMNADPDYSLALFYNDPEVVAYFDTPERRALDQALIDALREITALIGR